MCSATQAVNFLLIVRMVLKAGNSLRDRTGQTQQQGQNKLQPTVLWQQSKDAAADTPGGIDYHGSTGEQPHWKDLTGRMHQTHHRATLLPHLYPNRIHKGSAYVMQGNTT